jgi:hypothetical protein
MTENSEWIVLVDSSEPRVGRCTDRLASFARFRQTAPPRVGFVRAVSARLSAMGWVRSRSFGPLVTLADCQTGRVGFVSSIRCPLANDLSAKLAGLALFRRFRVGWTRPTHPQSRRDDSMQRLSCRWMFFEAGERPGRGLARVGVSAQ